MVISLLFVWILQRLSDVAFSELAFPGKAFYDKALSNNGIPNMGDRRLDSLLVNFKRGRGPTEGERKTEILAQQRFLCRLHIMNRFYINSVDLYVYSSLAFKMRQ